MNLKPTLMYYFVGENDREGVYMRFEDIFSAREAYRRIRAILERLDMPHNVKRARVEEWSGQYEFDIMFYRGVERPEIRKVFDPKPPFSNRGVTDFNQGENAP